MFMTLHNCMSFRRSKRCCWLFIFPLLLSLLQINWLHHQVQLDPYNHDDEKKTASSTSSIDIDIAAYVGYWKSSLTKSKHGSCHKRVIYLKEDLQPIHPPLPHSSSSSSSSFVVKIRDEFLQEQQQQQQTARNVSSLPSLLGNSTNTPSSEECVPMEKWQTTIHPSCNVVHELYSRPQQLEFLDYGSVSFVLQVHKEESFYEKEEEEEDNDDSTTTMIVLKGNLLVECDFTEYYFHSRRKDAMIQEHLTASPFVMNIYGYCGTSVLAPLATSGSLYDYIHSVRRSGGGQKWTSQQKHQVAIQMANGLADVHAANVVHNDLDVSQYVFANGIFQLNDFNHGKLLLQVRNTTSNNNNALSVCFEKPGMTPKLYRAPEDLAYVFAHHPDRFGRPFADDEDVPPMKMLSEQQQQSSFFAYDQADVYGLGMALYMMLTNQWGWPSSPQGHVINRNALFRKVLRGERPPIPNQYYTNNAHDRAIVQVIRKCWQHDPTLRPTAKQVALELQHEYQNILGMTAATPGGEMSLDELRIEMPPLVKKEEEDGDEEDFYQYV
jgi:Protein tyrosine and serine/threonine kinase